ncbi:MAG: alpha-ketoglutarate-dependent dioxygenase AlkB family protein [Pseudomonadales bacterium]
MTMDLFSQADLSIDESDQSFKNTAQKIPLVDGQLVLYPHCFSTAEANHYFEQLQETVAWTQEKITMYGKTHNVPRLSAWYGDEKIPYTYSGITAYGLPWTESLQAIKSRVEQLAAVQFNSVLANLYRDGADSVSWHADDEPELGPAPVIASVSLGQERTFQLKHKFDKTLKANVLLPSGSVLVMSGATQQNWLHQIAKSRRIMAPRINLTFRWVDKHLASVSAKI